MWFKLAVLLVCCHVSLAQFGVVSHDEVKPTSAPKPKPQGGFGVVSHDEVEPTSAPKPKPQGGFGVVSHDEVTPKLPTQPPTTKKPAGAAGDGQFGVGGQGFVTEAAARPAVVTRQAKPSFNNVLCKYGIHSKRDCCYGWKRVGGRCIPICDQECVHGKCVGPNKCQCDKGFTGPICNQDYNECGDMPWRCTQRCMNTLGSYKCYCDHGYILQQDQYTCSRDNRCDAYRCVVGCEQYDNGFRCICPDGLRLAPNGLSCIDIDECKEGLDNCAIDRVCRNTFGNFFCSCPQGLSFNYDIINGKKQLVCRDRNECDGPNECDANAECINQDPGYSCQCKAGYAGDGSTCTELDPRICEDVPCFPGVECVDVGRDPADPLSKLFVCRSCPSGYEGDGFDCLKLEQKLIVVVEDEDQPGVPVDEATVTILTKSDDTSLVTQVFDRKATTDDGFAELTAPSGESFIVTVSKKGYYDISRTYNVVPGKNVVKFELDRNEKAQIKEFIYRDDKEERVEFDFDPTPRARGDAGIGQDGAYAITFPPGSLAVRNGDVVQVAIRGIDVTDASSLARAPELVGTSAISAGDDTEYELWPLESFGMAEISVELKSGRDDRVALLKQVTIEFPLNAVANKPDLGEIVGAYYYDKEKGVWYQDGEGVITLNKYDDIVWMYNVTHLSWWNADRIIYDSNCVTVTACYDPDCNQPAGNTLITLSGNDFAYTTSQQTDVNGQTCFNFKQGGKIVLTAPCSGGQEFIVGSGSYSTCGSVGGNSIYSTNNINNGDDTACQGVKFVLQGISQNCPDPGPIEDGVRIGNEFTYGNNVTFFCDSNYFLGSGSAQRVCHSCGDWSGSQPHCFVTDYESSGASESMFSP